MKKFLSLLGMTVGLGFVVLMISLPIINAKIAAGATNDIPSTVAFYEDSLRSSISSSDTSFTLVRGTDSTGTALASSTYGFVIDEGTSAQEMVIADCTATACTGAIRGIDPVSGTTTVAALKKAHRRGASVKITDGPILLILQRLANGIQGFPGAIKYDSDVATTTFTNAQQIPSKAYVDYLAFNGAGVIDANSTARGVVEIATAAETAASTVLGGSGAVVVIPASVATSTAPTSGNAVLVSESDGNIAQGWLDLTEAFSFSGGVAANTLTVGSNKVYGSTKDIRIGETFTGATTPQPVYASTTDNEMYLADANVQNKISFTGFVTTSGAADASGTVQTSGIVSGFSGLATGTPMYLSDTVGTISSTPGTNHVLVGMALSPTEVQIAKGPLRSVGTYSTQAAGDTAVHLGFRPARVHLTVRSARTNSFASGLDATYVNGSTVGVSWYYDEATAATDDTTLRVYSESTGEYLTYSITSVTATGFTINTTENGTVDHDQTIFWEAEGLI